MKKLSILALPLILAACNGGGNSFVGPQPYNIQMSALGYEADNEGNITVASVTGQVVSEAGAGDVSRIDYTATLLNADGQPAIGLNNETIVPAKGTLIAGVKGGYYCFNADGTKAPSDGCWMGASNVKPVMTDQTFWPQNAFSRAIVPGEWARAHLIARHNQEEGTAPWTVKFTFVAHLANGGTVTWNQNFQFLVPVKAAN